MQQDYFNRIHTDVRALIETKLNFLSLLKGYKKSLSTFAKICPNNFEEKKNMK